MRRTSLRLLAVATAMPLALAPWGSPRAEGATAGTPRPLVATVVTSDGTQAGQVSFRETDHGVVIHAELTGLPPGPHGFHVHERGECTAPDFRSAGGHYAPRGHDHGFNGAQGYPVGDLPNLFVGQDGTVTADMFAPQLTVSAAAAAPGRFTLQDGDGSAIMIHESADDYQSADSAGGRIACGVIAPPQG